MSLFGDRARLLCGVHEVWATVLLSLEPPVAAGGTERV